ncbi:hypothetical protein CQA20_29340, partial [Klebsiella pneumoniae]
QSYFVKYNLGPGRLLNTLVLLISLFALLTAAWNPLDTLPRWAVATFIPPDVFLQWYQSYFVKYNLGPGRLLNTLVLLISLFALLTAAW